MTKRRDLKALVRERMAKTGESYITARTAVLKTSPELKVDLTKSTKSWAELKAEKFTPEELAKIDAQVTEELELIGARERIECIFCRQKFDELRLLKAHSAECPEHPAVKKARELTEKLVAVKGFAEPLPESVAKGVEELRAKAKAEIAAENTCNTQYGECVLALNHAGDHEDRKGQKWNVGQVSGPEKLTATELMKKALAAWGVTVREDGRLVRNGEVLKQKWTPELADDLKMFHAQDAEAELATTMLDGVLLSLVDREPDPKPETKVIPFTANGRVHSVEVTPFEQELMAEAKPIADRVAAMHDAAKPVARELISPELAAEIEARNKADEEAGRLAEFDYAAHARAGGCICPDANHGTDMTCPYHHPKPVTEPTVIEPVIPPAKGGLSEPGTVDVAQRLFEKAFEEHKAKLSGATHERDFFTSAPTPENPNGIQHVVTVDTSGMTPEEATAIVAGIKRQFNGSINVAEQSSAMYRLESFKRDGTRYAAPIRVNAKALRAWLNEGAELPKDAPTPENGALVRNGVEYRWNIVVDPTTLKALREKWSAEDARVEKTLREAPTTPTPVRYVILETHIEGKPHREPDLMLTELEFSNWVKAHPTIVLDHLPKASKHAGGFIEAATTTTPKTTYRYRHVDAIVEPPKMIPVRGLSEYVAYYDDAQYVGSVEQDLIDDAKRTEAEATDARWVEKQRVREYVEAHRKDFLVTLGASELVTLFAERGFACEREVLDEVLRELIGDDRVVADHDARVASVRKPATLSNRAEPTAARLYDDGNVRGKYSELDEDTPCSCGQPTKLGPGAEILDDDPDCLYHHPYTSSDSPFRDDEVPLLWRTVREERRKRTEITKGEPLKLATVEHHRGRDTEGEPTCCELYGEPIESSIKEGTWVHTRTDSGRMICKVRSPDLSKLTDAELRKELGIVPNPVERIAAAVKTIKSAMTDPVRLKVDAKGTYKREYPIATGRCWNCHETYPVWKDKSRVCVHCEHAPVELVRVCSQCGGKMPEDEHGTEHTDCPDPTDYRFDDGKPERVRCMVNGVLKELPLMASYRDVLMAAGYDPERTVSVTYSYRNGEGYGKKKPLRHAGTMHHKSEPVEVLPCMVFNAMPTGNA